MIVYIAQLLVVTLIYRLDGYRNLTVSLYAGIISLLLLVGYLAFRFIANRSFYKRLEQPLPGESLTGESSAESSHTPLAEALHQLLKTQFRHYTTDLHNYKHKIEGHLQFINQWAHQMKTPISVIHLILQDDDDPRFAAIGDELDRLKKGSISCCIPPGSIRSSAISMWKTCRFSESSEMSRPSKSGCLSGGECTRPSGSIPD